MKNIKIIALLFVLIFISCKKNEQLIVETGKVQKKTIVQKVSALGKIQPETEVKISSEVSGELVFIGVKEGDNIKRNQILARVKPDIIETQLEASRANVTAAQTDIEFNKSQMNQRKLNFDRTKSLFDKNFASQQEFELTKAQYDQSVSQYQSALARFEQANASLKEVQRNADRTTIFAPMDGILTSLSVEIGEKILGTIQTQGTEIMRVSDLNIINAMVEVDENDIVNVSLGDTCRIEIDAFPDSLFIGYVYEIGHSAIVSNLGAQDQVTNFQVKVRLININNKLRPGMSCSVEIETETKANVIAVPLQAVTLRDAKTSDENESKKEGATESKNKRNMKESSKKPSPVIFLFKNGKASQKSIEVGISDRGFIEVISGLEENQEIIIGPYSLVSKELMDGMTVSKEAGDKKDKGSKWKKEKK